MRIVSLRRRDLMAACLILIAVLLPSPAPAQDEAIRKQISKLANRDADVRQEAIEALGQAHDERVVHVLQAMFQGNLVVYQNQVVERTEPQAGPGGKSVVSLLDPLTGQALLDSAKKPLLVDPDEPRELRPKGPERALLSSIIKFLQDFGSSDPEKRLLAVRRLGDNPDATFLPLLESLSQNDPEARIRRTAGESAALTRLGADIPDQKPEDRLAAISTLARLHSVQGQRVLQQMVQQNQVEGNERTACEEAIRSILRYQFWVRLGVNLTNGLSAGSILILMALGLSIIYGQMGVINMAHGELMMLGAYATYEMQLFFTRHFSSDQFNWYYVAALPFAFCVSAFVGWLIELIVVRHLYGRALETLLATWGVSLILVQAVRVRYGDNIGVSAPTWLRGGFDIIPYLTVEYARCFILVLCACCVAFLYGLMNFTRIGLKIRATVQGRETAESLGINTRRIDGFAFSLGAGLAGIAGCALTSIAGVTPDMGQNYIVDSFLVVVTGGVGKLAGSVWAGLGLGTLNQLLEPRTFGEALLATGLVIAVVYWINLVVHAFKEGKKWGWLTLLVPVPLPLAVRFWRHDGIARLFLIYCLAVAAGLVGRHHSEALVAPGLVGALVAWIVLAVKAFGQGTLWGWLTLLVPIPLPLAVRFWRHEGIDQLFLLYCLAVAALVVGMQGNEWFGGILTQDIQTRWARVFILLAVVIFIQWRPAGLFPPKGRLADV